MIQRLLIIIPVLCCSFLATEAQQSPSRPSAADSIKHNLDSILAAEDSAFTAAANRSSNSLKYGSDS
ncbi:MAG TPA: hypothetical protein VE035_12055, partial [Puia sp.]|nr:hypothetical protein [Puia sp.]